ncbi:MAG: hypothetical protein PHF84_02030 [bacterium]|nr:hypothetical protein [bacterium]
MKEKLSYEEIKLIINKLREQYEKFAEKYGKGFFNKQAFESRYIEALKSGVGLQAFVYAEVAFFEDLKAKLKEAEERNRIKTEKPFTKKVEHYIEEMEKRWRKYTPLFTDTEISDEAQHFCGAVKDFYNEFWLTVSRIVDKNDLKAVKNYNQLTDDFHPFIFSTKKRLPYEVETYLLNLSKYDVEKANMIFLKQGVHLLKKIKRFLHHLEREADARGDIPVPADRKNGLEQMLQKEYITKTDQKLEELINDFRFHHLI